MTALAIPSPHRDRVFAIIDAVTSGQPLRDAITAQNMNIRTFQDVLIQDREAALRYSHAQEFRADIMADEMLHIADGDGDPAKVRNQITTRQWLASKLNKKYGERIDLNVSQVIDISATLQAARGRALLPVRDQYAIADAQMVPVAIESTLEPTDKQSVRRVQEPGDVPDIFS